MKKDLRPHLILIVLLLVSFAARSVLFKCHVTPSGVTSYEYSNIAENIVSGKGYSYNYLGTAFRSFSAPLYPFTISLLYRVFGISVYPVIYLQILLALLTCIVIFKIAYLVTENISIAAWALALCAFHPGLFFYSIKKIHALNLDVLLFSSVLLSVLMLKRNFSLAAAGLSGFLFGITMLTRATIFAFFPCAVAWLIFTIPKKLAKKMPVMLVMLVMLVLPVSFWAARNYQIHKRFIPITTSDGHTFWRGNNPNATGTCYLNNGKLVMESDERFYEKAVRLNELDKRDLFRREAFGFVSRHPLKFLSLFVKKFYYFWWFSPAAGMLYPDNYLAFYKVYYVAILLFGAIGVIHLFRTGALQIRRDTLLLILFLLSISSFQSLFYIEGRHRWGIEPIMLIFAATGAVISIKKLLSFCSIGNSHGI